ncbi:TD and POZ domain-containing protein 4 [Caerostris extrusa]|uniref:TD and POZ domain-containing protein 4 n=1 Tax=Caerostris extrusa TaxID=172846 RepID=A0AAV4M3Q5_CAEEX|nr:TD and POZ domain-containing protein 4 [Caerostris extrusa]
MPPLTEAKQCNDSLVLSSAVDDLIHLYDDQILCDLQLKTKTKTFHAHKTVLCARSPAFRAMLMTDMKERIKEYIKVEDLEDGIMHLFLTFLYSDVLKDLQWENVAKLYYAADKYEVKCLKAKCSSFLIDMISISNASDLLLLADSHADLNLKELVEDFILKHDTEIFGSNEWGTFMERNSQLAVKTMQLKYVAKKALKISPKICYPSVLEDLMSLYIGQLLNDVELKTRTTTFPAHRAILCARSPVFRAMFQADMKETITACIEIEDMEDNTLNEFLWFLYTDGLGDLQWDVITELYYAADKYQVSRLKAMCSSVLMKNIAECNACEILHLADVHQDSVLKECVVDFILLHHELFKSDMWENFMATSPKLAMETMHLYFKKGN